MEVSKMEIVPFLYFFAGVVFLLGIDAYTVYYCKKKR